MPVPEVQCPTDVLFYVAGDVTIHPSAAIASEVLLQANVGSQIIIGEGVCIGAGSIIHAYQGILEIRSGVTLGTKVLIVGSGYIGANACVGSHTTIFDCSVEEGECVPSQSLIVDESLQHRAIEEPANDFVRDSVGDFNGSSSQTSESQSASNPIKRQDSQVYGLASVKRLTRMMFPHRLNSQGDPTDSSS
ncbi:MAG: transferase [Elainellaceae cyanobacterium]